MTIEQYIEKVSTRLKSGISREHSYRGDLETLIRELVKGVEITNEPANVTDCGNPDYVITKGKIPIGYIEAKDIGKDLNSKSYKEQFDRYKKALDNLIITDYVWFQFFKNGELVHEIRIAEIVLSTGHAPLIKPINENFAEFTDLIKDFCTHIGQTIKSSKKLAEMMASKARLLQDILERAITSDEESEENTSLREQYKTFKDILIHDLSPKAFADIYAQTLAYGMFAARLHDETLDDFSRQEAAELIPKSNPFLRKLFAYVAGPDIDDRIVRTVDNLAEVFRATNVEQLLKNFGKSIQTNDPIIHFYETFLAEYDPKLRKARGVWYTPEPVVNFIVRAVDDILKTEFDLPQGLADTSKTKIKVPIQGSKKMMEKEVHKVQILDPATGTGTFLAEVVKYIYSKKFKAMQGAWSSYVDEHLIPRLNGFELLMASYSMAHLKLDMLLHDTGYKATKNQRFNIYLTNSLEEHHPDTGTLFSNWLSTEANEANHIKRDTPVMVVMGNPPYAVSSTNKSEWIQNLLKDYKKDLNERKINLDDDYIKFLRYGEYFIDKTGEGILAYISNNSFIDGITHRQMRKHLLETFDKVYILDLHGNSKKKETAPDGSADQNVFDIMQGVSINIFVKKSKSKKLGEVKHFDAYGKRQNKYDFLNENSVNTIDWNKLNYKEPYFFFVPKDFEEEDKYKKMFSLTDLFTYYGSALNSERNSICVRFSKSESENVIFDFNNLSYDELKEKYSTRDSRDWKLNNAIADITTSYNKFEHKKLSFKPFDNRWIYYTGKSRGFIGTPSIGSMKHMLKKNIALIASKQSQKDDFRHVFLSEYLIDRSLTGNAGAFGVGYVFPLYLYPDQEKGIFTEKDTSTSSAQSRKPNLNLEIVAEIAKKINLTFTPEKTTPPDLGGVSAKGGRGGQERTTPAPHYKEELRTSPSAVADTSPYEGEEFLGERFHNLPHLKTFRKTLRNNLTPAEATLWNRLKGKQVKGRKFRRQHSVANYILDFYCPSEKLAIELDGDGHFNATQAEYDYERDLFLKTVGIKVLRFENKIVFENPEAIIQALENEFGWSKKSSPLLSADTPLLKATSPSATSADTSPYEGEELEVFASIDVLDYIYAVLHSPTYREKYKEFLKIDFPRVPYPKDKETFWQLVKLGGEIRQIHLLESPKVEEYITSYPIDGDNKITTKIGKKDWELISSDSSRAIQTGRIWINENQYFDNIPLVAWEFYIGGYQPAQKWLKDRKDRTLSFEDILHYQKIIVALTETDRLMKEIDRIDIE